MGHKHSVEAFDAEKHREKLLKDVIKVEQEIKYIEQVKKQNDGQAKDKVQKQSQKSRKYNLSEINWPDPDPKADSDNRLLVDDVTRMNAQCIDRLFFVRSAEDIKYVLKLARKEGKTVSMRGTKHSM